MDLCYICMIDYFFFFGSYFVLQLWFPLYSVLQHRQSDDIVTYNQSTIQRHVLTYDLASYLLQLVSSEVSFMNLLHLEPSSNTTQPAVWRSSFKHPALVNSENVLNFFLLSMVRLALVYLWEFIRGKM